jgi:hypothetical protein
MNEWIKYTDQKPKHHMVIEVLMKDGTYYDVCFCIECRTYLKEEFNASEEAIQHVIDNEGEIDITHFGENNSRQRVNVNDILEWKLVNELFCNCK